MLKTKLCMTFSHSAQASIKNTAHDCMYTNRRKTHVFVRVASLLSWRLQHSHIAPRGFDNHILLDLKEKRVLPKCIVVQVLHHFHVACQTLYWRWQFYQHKLKLTARCPTHTSKHLFFILDMFLISGVEKQALHDLFTLSPSIHQEHHT